jgi:carbonic anhydrase/acetyltransferase-like protein (isoleucine patch superfamily)
MTVYSLGDFSPELPKEGEYWIAPSADVMGRVRLGIDASVWFGAVLRGDNDLISVGNGSNIQDRCVLHTDAGLQLSVGSHCTIGHGATLHGCTIGNGTLVGMGATILNRAMIGSGCLIGASSLVTEGKLIPDQSLVMGSPAKVIRSLTVDEIEGLRRAAESYVKKWKRFSTYLTVARNQL